jgi:hypothetical protein
MDIDLYSYLSRALLTEESLDRNGRRSKLVSSNALDAKTAERLSLALLDDDVVTRARRMATVYTAIASFENSVRYFISKKLLEEIGADWWEKSVSEKIRTKAESRRDEENKIRWHARRGDSLLNYTEFGDLHSIISQNWELFEDHLQEQEWVRDIINTLERSRNVIMHSGELENEDIERIGQKIRDWVRQVGA